MRKDQIIKDFLSKAEVPLYVVYRYVKGQPNELKDMRELCLASVEEANQFVALEYLYVNGLYDELNIMLKKTEHASSRWIRKATRFYQMMYERKALRAKQLKPDAPAKYIRIANRIKLEEGDYVSQILRDLLYVYSYFDMHQYGKIGTFHQLLKDNLSRVQDPLLHELLENRLTEVMFNYHWKRNELILSRKYGYKLLKETNNARKKIDIHNMLAQGYLFESYDQAMHHVFVAIELANQIQYERALYGLKNYTLPFIAAYYQRTEGITSEDLAEQAHIALAENDIDTCIRILEGFEELTPFQQYYLGKAKQDKYLLRTAYQRFIEERDDYFYARLPLEALNALDQ
ncbi:AimR family lysis-lysogeny pheromone receptor [Gracilibacillus sp. S3-1-1]|uniref:AimR family lysis-lysogeny pheromone receptor n=1 Tax=Gracilibacillus pellucidus TaxID=3095368 RepID=A0ACC6M2C5_9BACI|nr:AimR family lysis-lysogeny pheromone receptor [Gracilibacillus sp. S3-1-1]MDX8045038.1 AimR family lysis-lysogeny pheromone receptor [Gracilibacillus sp. S3-1-1]